MQIVNGTAYVDQQAYHYRQAGDVLFAWLSVYGPAGLGPVPEAIQYYCCAQFVVTKARIQKFPREFYLQVSTSLYRPERLMMEIMQMPKAGIWSCVVISKPIIDAIIWKMAWLK